MNNSVHPVNPINQSNQPTVIYLKSNEFPSYTNWTIDQVYRLCLNYKLCKEYVTGMPTNYIRTDTDLCITENKETGSLNVYNDNQQLLYVFHLPILVFLKGFDPSTIEMSLAILRTLPGFVSYDVHLKKFAIFENNCWVWCEDIQTAASKLIYLMHQYIQQHTNYRYGLIRNDTISCIVDPFNQLFTKTEILVKMLDLERHRFSNQ